MMSVFVLAVLTILIFIIHECEEIIRFSPWIAAHKHDLSYSNDMLVRRWWAYPSRSTIIIMVTEEVLLFAAALVAAWILSSYELVVAVIIANGIHLIGHCIEALRTRRVVPGVYTALPLVVVSGGMVTYIVRTQSLDGALVVGYTIMFGCIALINLLLLHKNAHRIEALRVKITRARTR